MNKDINRLKVVLVEKKHTINSWQNSLENSQALCQNGVPTLCNRT